VDELPGIRGAQGVGFGNIIIYEGDWLNRALTTDDPIVAFTTLHK